MHAAASLKNRPSAMIRPHRCPVCDKEFVASEKQPETFFPFCSSRCRSIDLFRWWDGRYRIVEDLDPQTAELLAQDPELSSESSNDGPCRNDS